MGPMSLEVMETVPEFRRNIDLLKELDRFELVWAVCGGNPAEMVTLQQKMRGAHLTPEGRLTAESARELAAVVDEFALERVRQALGRVTELKLKHPEMNVLLTMFQTDDIVFEDEMLEKKVVRPDDDKVLRAADTTGALIPADAATALVLRHGLTKRPTIEELRDLVGQVRCARDSVWALLSMLPPATHSHHHSPRALPALHTEIVRKLKCDMYEGGRRAGVAQGRRVDAPRGGHKGAVRLSRAGTDALALCSDRLLH